MSISIYPGKKHIGDPKEYLSILKNLKYQGALDYVNSKPSPMVIKVPFFRKKNSWPPGSV